MRVIAGTSDMVGHALDVLIRKHALPQQLLLVKLVHIVVRLDFLRSQHTH